MKVLHIVPGVDDRANGMAVVARFLAKEQGEAEVVGFNHGIRGIHESGVEEVWVHGMWLSKEWQACRRALKSGKRLVRMPHGSVDPVRLKYHGWKKWLVGPIEKWCLRRSDRIVATCEAEKGWIEKYLGKKCPPVEVTDIKRFFDFSRVEYVDRVEGDVLTQRRKGAEYAGPDGGLLPADGELHLLYLGRRHPLKGVEYLEEAVRQLNSNPVNPVNPVQNTSTRSTRLNNENPSLHVSTRSTRLNIISSAFGDELEKVWLWCDVLVLPTLSENFGLVIAEALERGKRVITTDGAPAWGDGNDYGGRLVYLKGFRDGTDEARVSLLKDAIEKMMGV